MSNAAASCPPGTYRAIKIEFGGGSFTARGINNRGEVVGHVGSPSQALLWLPTTNYGFNNAGTHSLDPSEARALHINADGIVVGVLDSDAFYWDLDGETSGVLPVGGSLSEAVRVNDAEDPWIVGEMFTILGEKRGFRLHLDHQSNPVDILEPAEHEWSTAFDLNLNAIAVGESFRPDVGFPGSCDHALLCQNGECITPTWWDLASTSGSALAARPIFYDWETPLAVPRAINDQGHIIGDGENPPSDLEPPGSCEHPALFWKSRTHTPEPLPFVAGAEMPSFVRPLAMTNPDDNGIITAVGRTVYGFDQNVATRWTGLESGPWEALHLENLVTCGPDNLTFTVARDINENGWIIAHSGAGGPEHYVLVPLDHCPGDIAGDQQQFPTGAVGVPDLLYLLSKWDTSDCIADLNCDGIVNVDDLLTLLANWGTCPGYPEQNVPSLEEELNAVGLTMDDWDDFMDVMDSGTPAERENWLCWMERYLTQCQTCRPCPDSDPFAN